MLCHPNSTEWIQTNHVGDYILAHLRQLLEKSVRAKLRSGCPCPSLPNNITATPVIDPNMVTIFTKYGKDPKKGVDRALSKCQDRLLDISGPLTRIMDLAETAKIEHTQVDPATLSNWAQRATCLLGDANTSISQERRKTFLLKMYPKLCNLSNQEKGQSVNGLLFGDSFLKEMGKYVTVFNTIDKAQYSLKKIF